MPHVVHEFFSTMFPEELRDYHYFVVNVELTPVNAGKRGSRARKRKYMDPIITAESKSAVSQLFVEKTMHYYVDPRKLETS
jgi:hypothetical protein